MLGACLGRDIQTEIRVMRGQARTRVSQRKRKTEAEMGMALVSLKEGKKLSVVGVVSRVGAISERARLTSRGMLKAR